MSSPAKRKTNTPPKKSSSPTKKRTNTPNRDKKKTKKKNNNTNTDANGKKNNTTPPAKDKNDKSPVTKTPSSTNRNVKKVPTPSNTSSKKKRKPKKSYASKLILPPTVLMQQQRVKVYKLKKTYEPVVIREKRKLEHLMPKQSYAEWYEENIHKTIPAGRQKTLKAVLSNNTLFDITIVDVGMDHKGAALLGKYLMYNQAIWSMDLSRNNIAEGAVHIFNAVAVHKAIKTLVIDSNGITNDSVKSMSDMLLDNELLQTLSLSGNYIDGKGTVELIGALRKNVTLKSLNLSKQVTKFGPKGAKAIADGVLGGMPLESLDISGNGLGYEGAEHLAAALKNIKPTFWGTLQKLNISSNNLGRKGAKAMATCLAKNTTLHELDMSWNNLGQMKTNEKDPVGIRVISNAMKKNKGLKVLNLSGNNMSNRGATFISEMLQENKTLVSLSLRCNGIESIAVQDLLNGYKRHKALSSMDMGGNTVPFGSAASTYDKDAWVHPELLRLRKPYGVELVPPPPKGFVLSATVPRNMMIQPGNIPKPIQPQTTDIGKIRSRWYV